MCTRRYRIIFQQLPEHASEAQHIAAKSLELDEEAIAPNVLQYANVDRHRHKLELRQLQIQTRYHRGALEIDAGIAAHTKDLFPNVLQHVARRKGRPRVSERHRLIGRQLRRHALDRLGRDPKAAPRA